ncbi:hypothetical protein P280DRAFT_85747 [Massarina eburnea CBS 473.64]|uniref:Uncharacterized protein n=1 Tax=Massarina eburnea CBS 473.64 TaxID=1395130 RepID=A0A6A6RRQ8_9PLEO|nr:hypothetical protein P280DRAFT_85747 [Massarina eburnea CBS 473.64]
MRELGLSSGCKGSQRGGYNIPYSVLHGFPAGGLNPEQQKYTVDGRTYGKSGAYYKFVVNPIEGAIYAQNVHSPSGQKGKNWIDLPKLRALSDVLWGYWNRENPNVKNINKFLMQTVVNRDSQRIIARAFRQTGKTFGGWPGTDFSMDSMEGWAILGSPNGAAFGHFLMGHKAELGLKRISKVKVVILDAEEFPDQTEAAPDLVFFVEDVPPGTEVPWYPNPPSGVVAHQLDVRNSSSEVPLRAML